jgi:hypothetical protein
LKSDFFMLLKKQNFVNDNDSYWLGWLIYLFMIDEHNILVEFRSNSLMQLVILTQKFILQKEKYLWIEMFEMNDIMIKKARGKQQVE